MLNQGLRGDAVIREQGDTGAAGDAQFMQADVYRGLQSCLQLCHQLFNVLLGLDIGQHDDKLITADTGQCALPRD